MPLVRRTRATFRSAEFGFFGVCVNTRTHTPRFCGLTWSAGLFVLVTIFSRPWRTSWLMVGISGLYPCPSGGHAAAGNTEDSARQPGKLRPVGHVPSRKLTRQATAAYPL